MNDDNNALLKRVAGLAMIGLFLILGIQNFRAFMSWGFTENVYRPVINLVLDLSGAALVLIWLLFNDSSLGMRELKKSQEMLKQSEEKYRFILSQADSIIFDTDLTSGKCVCSDNYKRMFGIAPADDTFPIHEIERGGIFPEDLRTFHEIYHKISQNEPVSREIRIRKADHTYCWCEVSCAPIANSQGVPIRIIGYIKDIHEKRQELEQLMTQARTDPMTGILNKAESRRMISEILEHSDGQEIHGFLVMDFDRFKYVNDTYGHASGDLLLIRATEKIKSFIRKSDIFARVGGDEFIIFLNGCNDREIMEKKKREIIEAVKNLRIEGMEGYEPGCSIGCACCPEDGTSYELLFQKADQELYKVKRVKKSARV